MKKLNFKIEEKECVLYTNENKKTEYIFFLKYVIIHL